MLCNLCLVGLNFTEEGASLCSLPDQHLCFVFAAAQSFVVLSSVILLSLFTPFMLFVPFVPFAMCIFSTL